LGKQILGNILFVVVDLFTFVSNYFFAFSVMNEMIVELLTKETERVFLK